MLQLDLQGTGQSSSNGLQALQEVTIEMGEDSGSLVTPALTVPAMSSTVTLPGNNATSVAGLVHHAASAPRCSAQGRLFLANDAEDIYARSITDDVAASPVHGALQNSQGVLYAAGIRNGGDEATQAGCVKVSPCQPAMYPPQREAAPLAAVATCMDNSSVCRSNVAGTPSLHTTMASSASGLTAPVHQSGSNTVQQVCGRHCMSPSSTDPSLALRHPDRVVEHTTDSTRVRMSLLLEQPEASPHLILDSSCVLQSDAVHDLEVLSSP